MLIAAHISGINGKGELVYEQSILEISAAERKFFCEGTILLEIEELLSCTDMIQRCQVSLGRGDPMAPFQARIKRLTVCGKSWSGMDFQLQQTAP